MARKGSRMRTPALWIFDQGERDDGARRGFDQAGDHEFEWLTSSHEFGWRPLSCWGADGWDLGDRPVVSYLCAVEDGTWHLIERCDGALTWWTFPTRDAFTTRIDELAEAGWRQNGNGPAPDVPAEQRSGPYRLTDLLRLLNPENAQVSPRG
jgi:hypothetical protein